MLMLIISSIILIVIPAFLAILIKKKISLSAKYLSIGMLFSIATIIKIPLLAFSEGRTIVLATIISTFIYVFAESIVRVYIHRKLSHQTINNILSIAIGYVSLKFVAIFLFQLFNFIQLGVTSTQYPELLAETFKNMDTTILYLGQIFHSIYIFLYGLMILSFIILEHQNVRHFKIYESIFFAINFIVILLVTTTNYLATIPAFFTLYFYFNLFLVLLFIASLILIYQYAHVDAKQT